MLHSTRPHGSIKAACSDLHRQNTRLGAQHRVNSPYIALWTAGKPVLVTVTGRYDPIRARLKDGSINTELASDDLIRIGHLPSLEKISESFRFITAPRRDPASVGEKRSVCLNVNSINATAMGHFYDDFWGKGPRRVQMYVFSISAPKCKVLNLKPAWHSRCINERNGNTTACQRYILDNFEALQDDRLILVGAMSEFGEAGVPYLKCLSRSNLSFEFQTDLVTHQTYWSGGEYHTQIQTSDCRAQLLIRNSD